MKGYLLILTLILAAPVFAQDKDDKNEAIFVKEATSSDYYYEEVVPAPNLKKDVLFDRAKKWIIANLKTGDNNINADEKEFTIVNSSATKIDRKMFFGLDIKEGFFDYKFHVWVKDDKFKVRVDNIMYYLVVEKSGGGSTKLEPRTYAYSDLENNKLGRYLKKQASEKTLALLAVFSKDVVEGTEVKKKNDW